MSILRNIGVFVAAILFAKGIGFLQSFVLAKTLLPAGFGIWVTLLLIIAYSPIVCLGAMETMLKKVPYHLARHEDHLVRETESGVFGMAVLTISVLVLVGVSTWLFGIRLFGIHSSLLLLTFLAAGINNVTYYFYWRFTAHENFKSVAFLDALRAVVAFALIAGLACLWGLRAAVIGYVLHETVMCVTAAFTNIRAHGWPGVSFNRALLWRIVLVGFPITILWWTLTLQATVDRVVLGSMLGPKAVGYFGLGISLVGGLALVPMAVGRVLYPRINSEFGKASDADSIKSLVLAPTLALGTLLANMQAVLLLAAPLLYNNLLPKYMPGLPAGQILLLGSFFACLIRNGANYLIATNRERVVLKYIVATLVFNIITDIAFVKIGWYIEGVALGTALAGLLLATLVWRRVLIALGFPEARLWWKIFQLYLPIVLLTSASAGLWLIRPSIFREWSAQDALRGIGLLVFVDLALWCFPAYRKEMPGWKDTLWEQLRSVVMSATRFANLLV